MSLSRDSRAEKKLKAARRAQFRLLQRFDYIDWEEDHLIPEVEALKAGRAQFELNAGEIIALDIEDDDEDGSAGVAAVV